MSKVYISGAVSNIPYDEVLANFKEAENFLYARGDEPVNPTKHCDVNWDWDDCMKKVIPLLLECDKIYMLKGWKNSRGAKLEHFIALKLGIRIEKQR